MKERKYPIGVQTFANIVSGDWYYVDKTEYIAYLLNKGKYFFLSRPRRFGKSLLISTLHAYFEGRRDLFRGLKLDRMDVDWTPSPVLHFDFNTVMSMSETSLEEYLSFRLSEFEEGLGIESGGWDIPARFGRIIKRACSQTGTQVAILIDEYDKPLLGLEADSQAYMYRQSLLKGFFGQLKSMEQYIRFAMLTGVARFSKVSIFSDLNNLIDLSLDNEFADICGLTEDELTGTFRIGIERLAEKREENFDKTLESLRDFYDGYMFAEEGSRLYNPFSVLNALSSLKIEPYWFETGTPTFLAKMVRKEGIGLPDLKNQYASRERLLTVGLGAKDPIPLLFQTGYLTIKSYDSRRKRYLLKFPNQEVETGFARSLLPLYIPESSSPNSPFDIFHFQDDILGGRPEDFMKRLQTLFAMESYRFHSESEYQSILYLIFTLTGALVRMESHTSNGRIDIEIETDEFIYIFELKFNRSVKEAMLQLHERDYARRYQMDSRTLFLIGANFTDKAKDHGLQGWEIERID